MCGWPSRLLGGVSEPLLCFTQCLLGGGKCWSGVSDQGACIGDVKIEKRCEIGPGSADRKSPGTFSRMVGQCRVLNWDLSD